MPNWCNNRLLIVGHESDIQYIKEVLKNDMYTEYDIVTGEKSILSKKLDDNNIIYTPERYKTTEGYNDFGYNYEILMFGAKWGFVNGRLSHETESRLLYDYESAWSTPHLLLEKLSMLFPQSLFYNTFYGIEMEVAGVLSYMNGREQKYYDCIFENNIPGEDDFDEFSVGGDIGRFIENVGFVKDGVIHEYMEYYVWYNEQMLRKGLPNSVILDETEDLIKREIQKHLEKHNNWKPIEQTENNETYNIIDIPPKETLIGRIGVDAGLCWIGDPCYIIHTDEELPKSLGKNWSEFCKNVESTDHQTFTYDMGGEGLGVVVSTGYGDGVYPVFIKKIDGRISQVRVEFIKDK